MPPEDHHPMDQWVTLDRTRASLLHQRCHFSSISISNIRHSSTHRSHRTSSSINRVSHLTNSSPLSSRIQAFQQLVWVLGPQPQLPMEALTNQSACTLQLNPTLSKKHPQHTITKPVEEFNLPPFLEFLLPQPLAETRCHLADRDLSSLCLERSRAPTLVNPYPPTSRDFSLLQDSLSSPT